MKKKSILFVIGSFNAGGAEKAMISQLQCFDPKKYEIKALVFVNQGLFKSLLPEYVRVLPSSKELDAIFRSVTDYKFYAKHPILFLKKIIRTIIARRDCGVLHFQQKQWLLWGKDIPLIDEEFDIAVGHLQGIPNYFVIDKVRAKRKNLWIHNEYSKISFDSAFDQIYFAKANNVITISEQCKRSLMVAFSSLTNRFVVLPNIVNDDLIVSMATEPIPEDFVQTNLKLIVSVGRLTEQKRFDRAIETAKILKERSIKFLWVIIGEGSQREQLQSMIDMLHLQNEVALVGLRDNPYKYIRRADIAVQTSDYEGKSVFADECKILCKVFVTTNYDTVSDLITNEVNGIITDMTPVSIADGIIKGLSDFELINRITGNLQKEKIGNREVIQDYYKVYEH